MGANRRNDLGQSRRFAPCHILALRDRQCEALANRVNTPLYLALLELYQTTKQDSQNGKAEHDKHIESIKLLKDYLSTVDKYIKHN